MALVGSGVGLTPARSAGVDVAATVVESSDGVVLPAAYRSDPPLVVPRGSSEFVISPVTTVEGTDEPYRNVIRVSDGAVVRTVRAASLATSANAPSIVGDQLITRVAAGSARNVRVDDLTSGQIRTYDIPAYHSAITYPDWAVTTQYATGGIALFLHRPDGTSSMVAGPYPGCTAVNLFDSDETGVIFNASCGDQGYFLLDIATGSVESAPGWTLTPTRVMHARSAPGGQEVTWAPRSDLTQTHTVTVAVAQGTILRALGDGFVAQQKQPCDATRCGDDLRAIDLTTGALGEVLASHVITQFSALDGGLHVLVDDGGNGELAILRTGEGLRVFAPLPAQPVEPLDMGFSGDRVVVSSREIIGDPVRQYAGGAWSAVDDPVTGLPLSQSTGHRGGLLVAGDSIASEEAAGRWRIVWPGGARTVENAATFTLGHRGKLVGLTGYVDDRWQTTVQDLRTGAPVWTSTIDGLSGLALDGSWLWRLVDGQTLEGFDTTKPGAVRRIALEPNCAAEGADVRGRWAAVSCNKGLGGPRSMVVDLQGGVEPYHLPYSPTNTPWRLGNDFAYEHASSPMAIRIVDFSAQHATRLVGPISSPAQADDAGSHALLWADPFGRLTRADLDWVTVPPPLTADRTAPKLVSSSGSARYVRSVDGRRTVSFGWKYSDPVRSGEVAPSGLASSYDVRWRTAPAGGVWSAWSTISRSAQTSISRTFREGRTVCFQVRGRDLAGNLSAWSSRCTTIDGDAPVLTRASIDTSRFDLLTFRFRATDTYGISHYVVRYRVGSDRAPWISPTRWSHLTQRSVTFDRSWRRTCFRVTAVDHAGHRDTATRCVRGR